MIDDSTIVLKLLAFAENAVGLLVRGHLARFARALHIAIKKGRGDPTFSPREKVPRRGG